MNDQTLNGLRSSVGLALSDGSRWSIVSGDRATSIIVSRLTDVMQLQPHCSPGSRKIILFGNPGAKRITGVRLTYILTSGKLPIGAVPRSAGSALDKDAVICIVNPAKNSDMLALQLMRLSLIIGRLAQFNGGLLIHGALAELDGVGVILAGPGGAGKTTASQRLPASWRSLSDDCTLVVRNKQGEYRAHPWPTWSEFMFGGPGGTWDVQASVRLKNIFFLTPDPEDRTEQLGVGASVCLIVNSAEQAWGQIPPRIGKDEVLAMRLQRFNNICSLAKVVPCYILRMSMDGLFWNEIARVIDGKNRVIS